MTSLPNWASAAAVIVTMGCAGTSTDVEVPQKPIPRAFSGSGAGSSIGAMGWRGYFADDQLKQLIAGTLEANPDLHVALQRIEVARAGVRQSTGALLPQVSAGIGAGISKPSRYTTEGSGNATTDIVPGRPTPNPVADLSVGLEATWEIDAWGKLRSMRESAVAQYLATIAGAQFVRTSLVSEVASSYFELLALDHTLDVLRRTKDQQEEAVVGVRLQKEAGRANELAVRQFVAQLASTKALEAGVVARIVESENRLNALMGRYPRAISRNKAAFNAEVPSAVATGVPSDLLENRPDVRAAELQLRSAKCDLDAAHAAFFPSLQITAGVGLAAFEPKYLLSTPGSIFYSSTVGLVAPLVNRSAIEAQFDAAKALQIEAMYNYQKVVLDAYVEVANGVTTLDSDAKVVEFKKEQKANIEQTAELAGVLYRAGKAGYFEVLIAQQNALDADLQLIDALRSQHLTGVRIYRALGGGWR